MQNDSQNPLGNKSIPSLLAKYSIPSVISMLVMALYNIVDQIFIGHSDAGYLGNASTTVVFPIVITMIAIALLIGNGSSAYISLQMGQGNTDNIKKIVGNAISSLTCIGILFAIASLVFLKPLLSLLGATDAIMPFAVDYGSIIFLGAPFAMIGTALSQIIRADGNPKFSMIASLAGAVLNTILDPIFIFTFNMGVKGAAIATVISQIVSAAIALYYICKKAKFTKLLRVNIKIELNILKKIFSFGSSSFVTQFANTILNIVMNNSLVFYGELSQFGSEIPLSAMGIVLKINMILISTILGIAIGSQPILGYNYGAKNFKRVKQTYLSVIAITTAISTIVCLLFVFKPEIFISAFGKANEDFNSFASMVLSTYLSGVFIAGFQIPSAIYFQATGHPVKSMILTMSRQVMLLIPAVLIFPMFWGLQGILYAGPFADVFAGIITAIFIIKELKNLKAMEIENSIIPNLSKEIDK